MRLKLIVCQVLTREVNQVIPGSPHSVDAEILPMGLHDLGATMGSQLQPRIDAADECRYDAILLGYALCGRGTEGLRAGKTQIVIPRAHDCIGLLMGSRLSYKTYFDSHPGVYFRSPGWVEFQTPGQALEPAYPSAQDKIGERRSLEELVAQYGEENGNYLFEQFRAFRQNYTGLTYISTGVESEENFRTLARAEAEKCGWNFDVVQGSLTLMERLVSGDWDEADFLVVPPGATVLATMNESIMVAL